MTYGPTAKLGLVAPLGTEQINQGDDTLRNLVDRLDAVLVPFSSGLMGARPTSTAGSPGIQGRRYRATDAFATFRDTGTSWEIESQTPQIVTSLPSGTGIPFDGQEIYFQVDATNGIEWHLRYRAAATGAHKWEPLGCRALTSRVDTQQSRAAGAGYADLATIGPQVTLPLDGDYEAFHGHSAAPSGGSSTPEVNASLFLNGVEVSADARVYAGWNSTGGGTQTVAGMYSPVAATAGQVLKHMYSGNSYNGTTLHSRRWISVRPLRVG